MGDPRDALNLGKTREPLQTLQTMRNPKHLKFRKKPRTSFGYSKETLQHLARDTSEAQEKLHCLGNAHCPLPIAHCPTRTTLNLGNTQDTLQHLVSFARSLFIANFKFMVSKICPKYVQPPGIHCRKD